MLHLLALLCLGLGIVSALIEVLRVWRKPEKMAVMNWVWPLVALSGGPLVLWLHRRAGKKHGHALAVATATCHCGAGCTLGDILAEALAAAMPGLVAWSDPVLAGWLLDTVLAFGFGIAFQYFAIAPMRGLAPAAGLAAALKADALSLLAWQAGMIGVMALVQFGLARLTPERPEFWFAMQLAMLAGFAVSYPVNAWLLKAGLKERM